MSGCWQALRQDPPSGNDAVYAFSPCPSKSVQLHPGIGGQLIPNHCLTNFSACFHGALG